MARSILSRTERAYQLRPGIDPDLVEDIVDVVFHRREPDTQLGTDLDISGSAVDFPQDPAFLKREGVLIGE